RYENGNRCRGCANSAAEKRHRLEDHARSDSACYRRHPFLVAAGASECALEPAPAFVWQRSKFRADKSGRATVRLATIGRQNLDRRFHFYNLPRPLSDHQHADERIAKAAREK